MERAALLRDTGPQDGQTDDTMVPSLLFLSVLGPTLFLIATALSESPEGGRAALYVSAGVAYAAVGGAALFRHRLPRWTAEAGAYLSYVLVSVVLRTYDDPSSPYALFYLWLCVHVFYFVPLRRAVPHLVVVAAAYAGVLLAVTGDFPLDRWLLTVGTVAAVAALMRFFRLRVERREARLRHYALHDPLTGLANRTLFWDRLSHAVARHGRRSRPLAVLYVDLDGFKRVNDELGHEAGDHLLAAVAERLRASVRASETVARFGGDEFAVLLEDLEPRSPQAVAERILESLASPFVVGTRTVSIGGTIGIVIGHGGDVYVTPEELMRQADRAMYAAKQAGGGTFGYAPD